MFFKNKYIPKNPGLLQSPEHIEKDWRKIMLGDVLLTQKVDKPPEYFNKWAVEHAARIEYSQKSTPSCVAETSSRVLGVLEYKETGQFKKPSVEAIMTYIKQRIEKNKKEGAWIESAPKSAMKYGSPFETELKSNYSLSWEQFISILIPPTIEEAGTRLRAKNYYWTQGASKNDIDTSIYMSGIIQGAVIGSNQGWKSGYVRPPKQGERTWGHSLAFIGYDNDYTYVSNSWSWKWGLTLYLKKKGDYYIKGTRSDYNIKVSGIGAIPRAYYEQGFVSKALGYIDLPDYLAKKTNMLNTIKNNNNYYVKLGNKWYQIFDPMTYNLLIEQGLCPEWNVPKEVQELPPISGIAIGRTDRITFRMERG